jgi:hypothetical protein
MQPDSVMTLQELRDSRQPHSPSSPKRPKRSRKKTKKPSTKHADLAIQTEADKENVSITSTEPSSSKIADRPSPKQHHTASDSCDTTVIHGSGDPQLEAHTEDEKAILSSLIQQSEASPTVLHGAAGHAALCAIDDRFDYSSTHYPDKVEAAINASLRPTSAQSLRGRRASGSYSGHLQPAQRK